MMKITKTEEQLNFPTPESFTLQEGAVQGAKIAKADGFLYAVSPKRYKLFTDEKHTVKILEGNGFFKWKRGETKFAAGDVFEMDAVGEYEINGNARFIVKLN